VGIYSITGTIRSIGQCEFTNWWTKYAFIEIVEPSRRRVLLQNVSVGNQVAPAIAAGVEGEFFIDRMFVLLSPKAKQLWGVKTNDGMVAYDRGIRMPITWFHLVLGLVLTPLFGLGLPILLLGLVQLLKLIGMVGARQQMFYGDDRSEAHRLRRQEAVRL
jgi:hypothetical protein